MSYHAKKLALSGSVGPAWYRAMNGMGGVAQRSNAPRTQVMQAMGGWTSQPPGRYVQRSMGYLGSLSDDTPPTTLSDPTVSDPTMAAAQWRSDVLDQLQAGVKTLQTAELQKWLQIIATVSIPLSAAIWRAIFKRGAKVADPTT